MNVLKPPDTFPFPFEPYRIQDDFMRKLYETLESGKYGIFESPTGTGKSLSIICGALRWLKDYNQNERDLLEVKIHTLTVQKELLSADADDWVSTQAKEIELSRELDRCRLSDDKMESYYKRLENLKRKKRERKVFKSREKKEVGEEVKENVEEGVDDDELLLNDGIGEDGKEDVDEEDDEDKYAPVKIYICSRTHSQLSQFIGEIRKSPFGENIRVATLASRQNYCINPDVRRLRNISLINDRCLDLQKSASKSTKKDADGKATKRQRGSGCKCPYFKQTAIEELRDEILLEVRDVEDLISGGKELKACPYYSSRKAVEDAEVVLVPYNTILHKATREANGLNLKNNVVIIDEAHNLLEALAQMYGAEVTYEQLHQAHLQLKSYKSKYSTRFSALNLLCINQLIFVVGRLKNVLDKHIDTKKDGKTKIFTITKFVLEAEIDNYNMFKLIKFVRDSKISQKLHGFVLKHPNPQPAEPVKKKGVKSFLTSLENKAKGIDEPAVVVPEELQKKPAMGNPLLAVVSFLEALTYSYQDGRILMHCAEVEHRKLQFLLLNPSAHFKDLVDEARAVIVAGGTMKPMSEFRDRLFVNAGAEPSKIVEFSCDHIIPADNILPIVLTAGRSNNGFLFNYESRFKMGGVLKELILDACKHIKGGIVVFFPSYKYELWFWEQVHTLDFGRPVFREPKDSGSVDSVLEGYHKAVYKSERRSALLLSVVGGKLSEGLNFSDDLGRCVIVVGLPYANIYSPELKEKMTFLDKKEGSGAGNKFYENLCMKAVNQCIGRAVRHKDDYATVLLVDGRYDRHSTKHALPDWIKRSLRVCRYEEAFQLINKFFGSRNTKTE